MKLVLTGTYIQETYRWTPVDDRQELLSTGQLQTLDIKASIDWKEGQLRFRFNSYEAIMADEPLEKALNVWADKIACAEGPHTSTWKDVSGGEWYGLTAIGPYISYAMDCPDFRIGVTGRFCTVGAKWWHRRWKGDNPSLRHQSTLLDLDAKSIERFADLYTSLYNPL